MRNIMKPFILCLFLGMLLTSVTATDRIYKQETKAGSVAEEPKKTEGWGGPGGWGGGGSGGWGRGGPGGWGCPRCCDHFGRCWCC